MGEGPSEELQEVENELINKKDSEDSRNHSEDRDDIEGSSRGNLTGSDLKHAKKISILTQALTLTFLAEW